MFDLTKLDLTTASNKGTVVTLKHPVSGDELPISIKVVGTDSTVFQAAIREQARKNMKSKNKEPDFDEIRLLSAELLAKCTLSWEGVSEEGVDIEFSQKAATSLYLKYDWIKTQIDQAIGERANFLLA